jgi:NitT/TauT family transport system substrate-binding protein
LQDQNSLATFAWLDAHGVDRSTIKFVEIPASATLVAMDQGRVDVATFYEPFFSAFMATGKVRIFATPFDALGKHYVDAVMYGTPQWANDHRDLVEKFLRATQEGAKYVAAHEREVAPITAEYTGADPNVLANMHHGGRSSILNPADLQPIIDAAAKYNMIAKSFRSSELVCTCALRR